MYERDQSACDRSTTNGNCVQLKKLMKPYQSRSSSRLLSTAFVSSPDSSVSAYMHKFAEGPAHGWATFGVSMC